jgi:predicted AlkP superfamily phosphohydrolase/phosphomutase
MFFDALDKIRRGAVACVFDAPDRIQHFLLGPSEGAPGPGQDVLRDLYRRMDDLVGRTLGRLGPEDVLLVLSDHGFKPFGRQVNLNDWLLQAGFLKLKEDPGGRDMFAGVDWRQTRAFALGFGGVYLNPHGALRDAAQPSERFASLRREIRQGLLRLADPDSGLRPIAEVYDARDLYRGPYAAEGPDLLAGFRPGYRASWRSLTGGFDGAVITENARPWIADHAFNPPDVPGVLFSNRLLPCARDPRLIDIAPTVLDLFGIAPPDYLDGRSLLQSEADPISRPPPRARAEPAPA